MPPRGISSSCTDLSILEILRYSTVTSSFYTIFRLVFYTNIKVANNFNFWKVLIILIRKGFKFILIHPIGNTYIYIYRKLATRTHPRSI